MRSNPHGPEPTCDGARPLMWITRDRLFYRGVLGAPSSRTMGCVTVYVATEAPVQVSIDGRDWPVTSLAVVPPYVPHRIVSGPQLITVLKIEAETVHRSALPQPLHGCGAVDAPWFVDRVRHAQQSLCAARDAVDLAEIDFDRLFLHEALPPPVRDRRIERVIDSICLDPSAQASAQECADTTHLSVSRFLHLFKQELGVPFRAFRAWKRARGLLPYVNRQANLAHVALDTGYPDSTYFSHSIRNIYGLRPRDIFAGSRQLAVFAQDCMPPVSSHFSQDRRREPA